jgi:GntR family transcriptional regulator
MTVRRAINILLDEGLVTTAQGRGTFVRPMGLGTATFGLQALEDLFGNDQTSVRMLKATTMPATSRISQKLALPADAKVISIRRLLTLGAEPVAYHREYLICDPERPIVEAELGITTLRGLFDGSGESALKRGDLAIETTVLTEEEGRLLAAPAGRAAFRIEHIFYDFDDRPVSWGWFIVRGDCLRFRAGVGVQSASGPAR